MFDFCGTAGDFTLPYYYVSDNYQLICMPNIEQFGVGASIQLCGSHSRLVGTETKILIKYTKD